MDKVREQSMKPSWSDFDKWDTGQKRGEDRPPLQKPYLESDILIDLPNIDEIQVPKLDVFSSICNRRSVRKYADNYNISLGELAYLLLSTNGILDRDKPFFRTAPSGGARHAIETYIYVDKMNDIETGLYRYLPLDHKLVLVHNDDIRSITDGLEFTFGAPVTFMWTAVPWRMEWRYGHCSEKIILIDVGHICQNLYLACESIGFGTCAVGAYDQNAIDDYMKLDGENEFLIYASPLGKKK